MVSVRLTSLSPFTSFHFVFQPWFLIGFSYPLTFWIRQFPGFPWWITFGILSRQLTLQKSQISKNHSLPLKTFSWSIFFVPICLASSGVSFLSLRHTSLVIVLIVIFFHHRPSSQHSIRLYARSIFGYRLIIAARYGSFWRSSIVPVFRLLSQLFSFRLLPVPVCMSIWLV